MLARVEEWWKRYIVGNERPPIGDSQDAAIWLQQAFSHHKRPDLRSATEQEIALLNEYIAVRIQHRRLEQQRRLYENQLREAVGNREGIEWPGGKFTWRKTKDREVVRWKEFAIGLRNEFMKDEVERDRWTGFYTFNKPGYRRILLDSDVLRDAIEHEGGEKDEEAADAA